MDPNKPPQTVPQQVSVTKQITFTSPTNTNYILTPSNLRPVTNYTIIASSPASNTQSYVTQTGVRTTLPQYINVQGATNIRHILASNSQPSNITYMLPSGAHIVRMSNVVTTTAANNQRPGTQYILTSSAQRASPSVAPPLGTVSQSSIISNVVVTDNSAVVGELVKRTIGMTYNTSPTFQRASMRLSAAYLNQIKRGETSKIAFRPRLNEQQRPRTSFILTSSDWARTKNVPVSSLQKIGTNYMQIPIIQKPGTVLPARTSVDVRVGQPQRPQHQAIRSVILPSNYRTAMSPPRATDCRVLLNSINVPTQVLASTNSRPRIASVPVTSIQRYSTNYMSIPLTQKPATVLTRSGPHHTIDNIRIGPQQHQTIRSLILPSNYRATMVSPRRGVDYRLILKPVNIQSQVLKNLPSPHHISPRQASPPLPSSTPTRVPVTRVQNTRVPNDSEIIASSKITPIPLKGRKGLLVISEGTIKMVINELNDRHVCGGDSTELTQEGIEIMQAEVSHKLFHLIRECKVMLAQLRTNVLTEEICREVCADFFTPFYGNKLWPLFCLRKKPFDKEFGVDDERVWIRKHNIVNVVGWIKHPKFRSPSYIKKLILKKPEPKISVVPNVKKQSNEVTSTSSDVFNGKVECSNNTKTLSATKIVCAPLKITNKQLAGEIPHISHTIIKSSHGPLNILSRHSTYPTSLKSLNISQLKHTPITRPVGPLNIFSRHSTSSPSRKCLNISHSSHVLAPNTIRSITTKKKMPNRSIDKKNNLLVTIPTMTGNIKVPRIILD